MDDQDVDALVALADERLRDADAALADDYPGDRGTWQPVHTVYVPADRFSEHTHREYGDAALGLLERNEELFREVTGVDDATLALVRDKLQRRPVEDLRVDFEDGYGARADADEDADARAACAALSRALAAGDAPGRIGIRFKSLEAPTRRRGLRTLTIVLDGLSDLLGDADVVVTLPKVTSVEQVETLVAVLEQLEAKLVQGVGAQSFEIQVETPQTILGPDGSALVARMIRAAGRTAGRPALRHLRLLRVPGHRRGRPEPGAPRRRPRQGRHAGGGGRHGGSSLRRLHQPAAGRRPAAERAGSCTTGSSRASLHRGFYQGWDLHPAQLPTRFAATFQFFRAGAADATARLAAYDEGRTGAVADEPATVRALADFLVRGLECGALTDDEVAQPRDRLRSLARRRDAKEGE